MTRLNSGLALVLILAGCTSSALPGMSPVLVESKYRSITVQACKWTPEFQRSVDLAAVLLVDELVAAGLIKDRVALARSLHAEKPIACQIEQPEPCSLSPSTCTAHVPACARKRGCGHESGLWIARLWPPVCKAGWPEEPHCVASAEQQSDDGWEADLVHELAEMLLARAGGGDAHSPEALAAQRRAAEAYKRARRP